MTYYQLLTGQLPFQGDSMATLMFKIANEKHPPLGVLRPDLPACNEAVMDKILAKDPETRYQRGSELADTSAGARPTCPRPDLGRMNVKGKIEFIGQSHPGKVRPHNEDAIGTDLESGLVVLADGMGGYKAGEVASAIAIQTVTQMVSEGIKKAHKADAEVSGFSAETLLLRDAIVKANEIINSTSKSQPQCEGMGTTIVACLYCDNRVSVAHVGDSACTGSGRTGSSRSPWTIPCSRS